MGTRWKERITPSARRRTDEKSLSIVNENHGGDNVSKITLRRAAGVALAGLALAGPFAYGNAHASTKTMVPSHKGNYTIGWADIYLTPSWMQETKQMIDSEANRLKSQGLTKFQIFNANGDTSQQIAQIRSMIDQHYSAIVVDAGSATALNPVIDEAVAKGIPVVNFDSLVTSPKPIKVNTDQRKWGVITGKWLVKKLHGHGKIIAMNGPAGVSVSEDRWSGAYSVLKKYPKINIVANVHSEYNIAPAEQAFTPVLSAHPDISGVYSQGGALSAGALQVLLKTHHKLVPMPGENYNGYLKTWKAQLKHGFSSIAPAQPNYLAVIALDAAVNKLQGKSVKQYVNVPLPLITDKNLGSFVPNKYPDDWYPVKMLSQSNIQKLIKG